MSLVGATVLACWLAAPGLSGQAQPPPASPAPAPDKLEDLHVERWDWSGSPELSAALRRLDVRNDYGDVRARSAGDGPVAAHAVLQRLGGGPPVGVNVERHGDVLAVTVVAPPGRVSVSDAQPPKTAVDRVDLVVYVPKACALSAESLRGLVEARGLEGDLSLVTLDGEIRAVAAAGLRASSAGGAITALLASESRAAVLLESKTGAVRLTLPKAGDYRLQAETAGSLESDLPLTGTERGSKPGTRRSATLQVGQGTRPIVVHSESGAVVLVRP